MYERAYWHRRIEDAWQRRSVVWLMGVRRVGKTWLCRSLENIEYFEPIDEPDVPYEQYKDLF